MISLSSCLRFLLALTVLSGALPHATLAEEERTFHRPVADRTEYPDWIFRTPEHYEFLPLTSNHDPQNQHPQQWDGQDWDPAAWNPEQWTPKIALNNFFEHRVFVKQYMKGQVPVLEVGQMFYKLSDLDQRRSLKLLADYTEIFPAASFIQLRDSVTHNIIGSYTPRGMFLN